MTRPLVFALVPFAVLLWQPPALAQSPKQAPKKPPVKAAPKAPAKAPAANKPEAPPPPPPDLSITASYVTGDKTTKNTILMHGARQRVAYDSSIVSIYQCDTHRSLQLNDGTRVYLATPEPAPAELPVTPAGTKRKGGQITNTTVLVDTGEKKEIFGFTARHLKTTVTKEASADACDKRPEKVEIDGWYIDLPATLTCPGAPPLQREIRVDAKDSSCSDVVTYVRPPASSTYPVSYTMVVSSGTDAPVTSKMEATEVKRITADAQQFDVPADYLEVGSPALLALDHRPGDDGTKKSGAIRIGVAPVANTSGQSVAVGDLTDALVTSFEESGTNAIALKGSTPAQLADDCRARGCDYILTNTVSEMKHPGKGMLGKISGTSGEALAAKIDYQLMTPGAPKPVVNASERSGTSMLQTAVGAAKRVSQIVLPMMMGYGAMNTFSAMSGGVSPGMMQQTPDPVLSAVFSLVDRATGTKPQPILTNEDGAAAAALQKEIDAVLAELKKRKGGA
jgi:hypothetical protein